MGWKLTGFLIPLLLVLPAKGTDLSRNGTSPDVRGPRASKRVVRLYSGTRPKPIVCEGEGFQADPTDCSIFHRCMRTGNGRFVSFRFQCGPGTIFDSDKEICSHPQNTKRTDCGGYDHVPSVEVSFDNEISRELPSALSTKRPKSTEKYELSKQTPKHAYSSITSKYPWISTSHQSLNPAITAVSTSEPFVDRNQQTKSSKTTSVKRELTASRYYISTVTVSPQKMFSTTAKIDIQISSSQSGDICSSNGFTGDSTDCRKFYRCISNQRGGFLRYEFMCSDPTIWDDDKQACNHVWAVKRTRCGRGNDVDNEIRQNVQEATSAYLSTRETTSLPIATQSQLQINYGLKVAQTQTQISNGSVYQNQTQINYSNRTPDDKSFILQNQTQIGHDDAISQSQTQINYGNKAVQTQLQIDHSKQSSQAQTQISQYTSTSKIPQSNVQQSISTTSYNNGCTHSGFMGDSEDCKKFYRCVDNGRGSFTRYEFSCGEGTVWDPEIEACNHEWAVNECGGKVSSETITQSSTVATKVTESSLLASTITTTQGYYPSAEPEPENNDIPYGNQPISTITNKPIEPASEENKQPSDNKCKSSGFMGDNRDCKKFYRCVDNGNGGYTRYEFTCGDGTVWDQRIEACNHAWAVENCGNSADVEKQTEKMTTTNGITSTNAQTTPQIPSQNDEFDTGYGQQPHNDDTSSTITTTSVKSTTYESSSSSSSNTGNTCTSSGFMGDNNDCKKFYRCVDNGNSGYTKYEFSCGEGTVWDPKIQACNHAWAVEKCGGNSHEDINKTDTTTPNQPEISSSSTHTYEPNENNGAGYGQQNQEPPSTSSTTGKPAQQNLEKNECTTSGFMGDASDCKKFYRCVDNGDGRFTRHEFSCGEGTVWDSKIDACNHEWAVEKCGGVSTSTSTQAVDSEDNMGGHPIQSDEYNQTTISPASSSTTTATYLNTDKTCKSSGFMGDAQDCKKFYRCVDDGHGGYSRYEFSCGEGTVWDQSIEACNHAWAVKGRCSGSVSFNDSSDVKPATPSYTTTSDTGGEDQGYQKPITETTSYNSTSNPSSSQCTQEGFYADINNCKNFYRCVDNGQGSFIKYEFTCGEGTVWSQDLQTCDHESTSSQCKTQATGSTTKKPYNENDEMLTESTTKTSESSKPNNVNVTSAPLKPQSSESKCENEGFYGDPNDCKKFYRCVDNGKGDFTKYDFICGDGTVWDQEILACNHENGNNECATLISTSTTGAPEKEPDDSESTQESHTTHKPGTITDGGSDQCTAEGFFANTNDCNRFYRCVDNGKGGFTKYDFACGEGTVWVQDIQACDYDNGISSCYNKENSSKPTTVNEEKSTTTLTTSHTTTEPQSLDKEDDEYPTESSSKQPETDEKCTSEGFFGNKNDCTRFYRCVDNGQGAYTKYNFTCGEGTAWDSNIQTCNHINEVKSCQSTHEDSQSKPNENQGNSHSSESTIGESTSNPSSSSNDKCEQEGYFGNTKDCTKFYRCVDNGKGGYTKYDFTCGEGTIWDQDVTTCNHPENVVNPSCKKGGEGQSSADNSSSTESSSSTMYGSSPGTTESSHQSSSNCSQESTSKKPENEKIKCEKAGFFADPDDCKKFYRCVDWDGDGKRFSIYHFDCGEGTIWDPQLETCNHEDSVYPPRDCSGSQSGNVSEETTSTSTTTTTDKSTTSEQISTTESTTITQSTTEENTTQQSSSSQQITQQTTTEKSTTQEPTTGEQTSTETTTTTTQQSMSTEKTTTQQPITSEKTTTQSTSTEQTTSEQSTTEETTTSQTTQETTTSQQTTTQQTTSSEQTNTEQPTTIDQPSQQSTTTQQITDQTTQSMTTSESTTQTSSGEQTTTQQSSTTEDNTEQHSTTTEKSSTATEQSSEQTTTEHENTTTESSTTTTESIESTTTESSQGTTGETGSSEKDCPETEDDQYLYVCPTSFRRHPKYCNMFYQCTEDDDSHDVKISMFKCPNNTIYDENKTQCVDEDKAEKKCDGQTAQRHRVKRLNSNFKEPIEASLMKHSCSIVGNYPYEIGNECSGIFLKCQRMKSGKLRSYVYRCPEGYTYWSVSKRCEKTNHMRGCKQSDRSWRDRWELPIEKKNIAN